MTMNEEILDLLKSKYNSENYPMFIQAIKAGCLDSREDIIEECMTDGDYCHLGLAIMNAVNAKLEQWAQDEVAGQFNSTQEGYEYE